MRKSLADIAWNVSEEVYRQDPALSYSTLAKFEREGFASIDRLFEKVESPSLLFGSCVDTLLTEGEEAFVAQYYISDIPKLKPSVEPVVKQLFALYSNSYTNINDISDADMTHVISQNGFMANTNWGAAAKCRAIRQDGAAYYQTMFMAGGKIVVSQDMYNKVFACVRALRDSPATQYCFKVDDPFEDVDRCYQLKFKGTLGGVDYRCMPDLVIVNHETKEVFPYDLKTSSHREYAFPKSFIQWRYDIQARLYWRLIRQNMDKDPYFKDFKLHDYRFIVANNIDNPVPLVWSFHHTQSIGEIEIGGKKLRDPQRIGEELSYYLSTSPAVPLGITLTHPNSIEQWFDIHGHEQC